MLSIPPTTEPAAYLARWPVIFEGSVTGLPSPRHEVPRVPASRDSLCINDKVYRFLSRSGSGWTGAGRTRRRVKIESFNGTRVQRANIECWSVELQHSEDTRWSCGSVTWTTVIYFGEVISIYRGWMFRSFAILLSSFLFFLGGKLCGGSCRRENFEIFDTWKSRGLFEKFRIKYRFNNSRNYTEDEFVCEVKNKK